MFWLAFAMASALSVGLVWLLASPPATDGDVLGVYLTAIGVLRVWIALAWLAVIVVGLRLVRRR